VPKEEKQCEYDELDYVMLEHVGTGNDHVLLCKECDGKRLYPRAIKDHFVTVHGIPKNQVKQWLYHYAS